MELEDAPIVDGRLDTIDRGFAIYQHPSDGGADPDLVAWVNRCDPLYPAFPAAVLTLKLSGVHALVRSNIIEAASTRFRVDALTTTCARNRGSLTAHEQLVADAIGRLDEIGDAVDGVMSTEEIDGLIRLLS